MEWKKLSETETAELLRGAGSKSHPLRTAVLTLRPGESIFFPVSSWKWKTSSPAVLVNRMNKPGGLHFICHSLADHSGWLIQRVDNLGNEPALYYLSVRKKSTTMLKKKTTTRNYSFADGVLEQKSDDVQIFLNRDLPELSSRGMTSEKIDLLHTKTESFKDLPDDEEWEGDVTIATQAKNAAAAACAQTCSDLRVMAQNTWGTASGEYKSFDFDGINTLPEDQRARAYRRVARRAEKYLPELAGEGLTVALITGFNKDIDSFDSKLDALDDVQGDRDVATEQRISLGNEVYELMVKYCNTAKEYWAGKSEAKYNDYVIYDTPSGEPETGTDATAAQ